MIVEKTHYDVLDIPESASQDTIREAYRLVATVWHPDRFLPNSKQYPLATEKLKQINAACAVLKDVNRRVA
jgi:DnaJ-class molecular chaperone